MIQLSLPMVASVARVAVPAHVQRYRDTIALCIDAMRAGLPEVDMPLKHLFAPGVYVRHIFMKKGTIAIGKIHRHEHVAIMPFGDTTIMTEDGVERLTGFNSFVTRPGIQRALYMHEDTVFITVHHNPDDGQDLEVIEDYVIAKSYDELDMIPHLREVLAEEEVK